MCHFDTNTFVNWLNLIRLHYHCANSNGMLFAFAHYLNIHFMILLVNCILIFILRFEWWSNFTFYNSITFHNIFKCVIIQMWIQWSHVITVIIINLCVNLMAIRTMSKHSFQNGRCQYFSLKTIATRVSNLHNKVAQFPIK